MTRREKLIGLALAVISLAAVIGGFLLAGVLFGHPEVRP
jgi:hypothetical protein